MSESKPANAAPQPATPTVAAPKPQPQPQPHAPAPVVADAPPARFLPQVGEHVRLPSGKTILVHAVMRKPNHDGLWVMAAGGPWLDGHGAVLA